MRVSLLAGLITAASTFSLSAQEIPALALSPDGATLLAAGDNRVLYTVDAATLTVSDRRYIPEQVEWVNYSADGRSIFMRTQERTFSAVDAGSFKEKFSAEDIVTVAYAADAGRLLLLENNYKGGVMHMIAASGKRMYSLEFPELRTDDAAISADGSHALLLTNSESSDAEAKEQPGSDLDGHAKYTFRQQHDGYISKIVSVDLKGKSFEVADSWYRISSPSQVRMLGDAAVFVNGVSDSGMVAADGTSSLLNLCDSYVSFAQITADGERIVMTSNSEFRVHKLENGVAGEAVLSLKGERIAGPSERVTSMAEAADGTLYLATSAFRILKIAPGATVIEAKPIF